MDKLNNFTPKELRTFPLLIRRAAQPAHQVAQDGEFFVEFFDGVPVIAVHADFAVAGET